jgi:hypothetical protein
MPARSPKLSPKAIEDPAEYARFVEAARKLGVDESPDALDRAFERIIPPLSKNRVSSTTDQQRGSTRRRTSQSR